MTLYLPQTRVLSEGDEDKVRVDLTGLLASGESIASVATPEEQNTSDLTLENEAVNSATYTDPYRKDTNGDNVVVAIDKAVSFDISGQLKATGRYSIEFEITTDAATPRKKNIGIRFVVV